MHIKTCNISIFAELVVNFFCCFKKKNTREKIRIVFQSPSFTTNRVFPNRILKFSSKSFCYSNDLGKECWFNS